MQQKISGRAQIVETLSQAIAEKRYVRTVYNSEDMILAPHQLFVRHDSLFLGAFNPNKNWRGPEDHRLSYFNISGFGAVRLQDDGFAPLDLDLSELPRPEDQMLMALERD